MAVSLHSEFEAELHKLAAPAVQIWREKRSYFISEGTATAFRLGSQLLLLTADHVLDANLESNYLVADTNGTLTNLVCDDTVRDSQRDVAVLRLSQAMQEKLAGVIAALPPQLSARKPGPSDRVAFAGFPYGTNRALAHKHEVRRRVRICIGTALSPLECSKRGYDIDRHFLIPFHRKRMLNSITGLPETAPKPHGMSGGPAWRLPRGRPPSLIGIGLEAPPRKAVMVGAYINQWIAVIAKAWPDLGHLLGENWDRQYRD